MKRQILYSLISFYIFQSFAFGSTLNQNTMEAILNEVFPKLSVQMTKDNEGEINIDGEDTHISVEVVKTVRFEDVDYSILIVSFPEQQLEVSSKFRNGEKVLLPEYKSSLIISSAKTPYKVKKVVIDPHALGTTRSKVQIQDFIGNGTLQIKINAESIYGLANPQEMVIANRIYCYQLPSLDLIFATTEKQVVLGEKGVRDKKEYDINLVESNAGPKDIKITDKSTGNVKKIKAQNGKYIIEDDEPWERKTIAKSQSKKSSLTIRVVDHDGSPIVDAMISGYTKKISFLKWSDKTIPIKGKTNQAGEFNIKVSDGAGIEISAEGYYTVKRSWEADSVPGDIEIIPLEEALPSVPMIGSSRTRKIWNEFYNKLIFGIRLIDGEKGQWKKIPTDNRNEADIWIEISQTEKDWRLRNISIEGRNGWALASGPMKEPDGKTMREAPITNYSEILEYTVSECPEGIYLSYMDGQRYGKIWGFKFEDRTRNDMVQQYLWVRFAVQAKEVSSRSLNPE